MAAPPATCRRRTAVCLAAIAGDVIDQQPRRHGLQRLPAIEGVAVVRRQEVEVAGVKIATSLIGAEKHADRQHRSLCDAGEPGTCGLLPVSSSTPRSIVLPIDSSIGRSRLPLPTRLTTSGITIGFLSAGSASARGSVCTRRCMFVRGASKCVLTLTFRRARPAIPDNWVMSRPLTSAKHWMNRRSRRGRRGA